MLDDLIGDLESDMRFQQTKIEQEEMNYLNIRCYRIMKKMPKKCMNMVFCWGENII